MKCDFCGANLTIDDEVCPYCHTPNTHYVKHWEKIISVMFPVSVRRHSLFTLYIRNFLHILLLEYMPQKASPQGENDTLWAHVIDVQIYSRFRRHSQCSLEDPVQSAISYAAYLYDYEWLFSNRNHNPLSKPNR